MIDELQAATLLSSTASAVVTSSIAATDSVIATPKAVSKHCQYAVLPESLDGVGLLSPYALHGGSVRLEV
jgi:hypothetical protein